MSEQTVASKVTAAVLVARETGDGARFLLIGQGTDWHFPIAVAGNVAEASGAALRQAREVSGFANITLNTPEPLHQQKPSSQVGGTRYFLATVATHSDKRTDRDGKPVSARRQDRHTEVRWVDLDQGLMLTPSELHAPLVQAAALLMKTATLASGPVFPRE